MIIYVLLSPKLYFRTCISIDLQGGAERMTNFEMATILHQGEGHMSGRYYFRCGVLAFFL